MDEFDIFNYNPDNRELHYGKTIKRKNKFEDDPFFLACKKMQSVEDINLDDYITYTALKDAQKEKTPKIGKHILISSLCVSPFVVASAFLNPILAIFIAVVLYGTAVGLPFQKKESIIMDNEQLSLIQALKRENLWKKVEKLMDEYISSQKLDEDFANLKPQTKIVGSNELIKNAVNSSTNKKAENHSIIDEQNSIIKNYCQKILAQIPTNGRAVMPALTRETFSTLVDDENIQNLVEENPSI